jgi:hypothetical protein
MRKLRENRELIQKEPSSNISFNFKMSGDQVMNNQVQSIQTVAPLKYHKPLTGPKVDHDRG